MDASFDTDVVPFAALVSNEDKRKFFITEPTTIVGRSRSLQYVAPSPSLVLVSTSISISRKHCIIEKVEDNKFTICDVSVHGTFVNNKRLVKNKPQELHHRDEIILANERVGNFLFLMNNSMLSQNQTRHLSKNMKRKLETLDSSHSEQIQKVNEEIDQINVQKTGMEEKMNAQREALQKRFTQDEQMLLKLDASTPEMVKEKRKLLEEMESKRKINEEMMLEMQKKIEEMSKKEEMLQKSKEEMEECHTKERIEIEARFQSEISELKKKLTEFEIEQERLLDENKAVERQLLETKQTLMDCELEQGRIFDEKTEVETRLESTVKQVLDLTKESDHKVETLEKELQDKNLKDEEKDKMLKLFSEEIEKYKKSAENVEDSLLCSICAEIFIEPMFIDCSHVFCKTCIDEWQKKKKICPMCRAKFKTVKRTFHMDGVIDAFVTCMPPDVKERREAIIKERSLGPSNVPVKKRKTSRYSDNTADAIDAVARGAGSSNTIGPVTVRQPFNIYASSTTTSTINRDLTYNNMHDAFHWTNRNRRRAVQTALMEPTVAVAAIDLTNVSSTYPPIRPNVIDPNTTIDLTSL